MQKICFVTFLLVAFPAMGADSFSVGESGYAFRDSSRERTLVTTIWYPISRKTKTSTKNEAPPFVPMEVAQHGAIARAPSQGFPIVLLSHGSGGLGKRLFWIGESLAQKGVVAVAVDHPGNKTGDTTAEGAVKVWDRAKDLSFALDRIAEIPSLKSKLDFSSVSAIGHSAGGATVLLLAGARFSKQRFSNPTPQCKGSEDPYYAKQCDQMHAIDYKAFPKDVVEADYTDARIKSVVALDPGFTRSFDPSSLKKLGAKAYVFAAEKLAVPQDEIFSTEFVDLMTKGFAEVVPNSYHMTFLMNCRPGLALTDPELKLLCIGTKTRAGIQREVASKSLAFFRSSWQSVSL